MVTLSEAIYQQSVIGVYKFPRTDEVLCELEERHYVPVERVDHRVEDDCRCENMPEGCVFAILWQTLHFSGEGVHSLWTADKDASRPIVDLDEAYAIMPEWWPVEWWHKEAAEAESAQMRRDLDKLRSGSKVRQPAEQSA